MDDERNLVALAARLSQAQQREAEAKRERLEAEEALIAATDFDRSEGQQSFAVQSADGRCTFTLKQPVNTNVDSDGWLKLRRTLPQDHPGRLIFRAKYDLDMKAARALQESDPKAWADVSSVVSRSPGKVQVDLKSVVLGAASDA